MALNESFPVPAPKTPGQTPGETHAPAAAPTHSIDPGPLRVELPRIAACWAGMAERRVNAVASKFQRARVFLLGLPLLLLPLCAAGEGGWAKYDTLAFSVSHSALAEPTRTIGDLWAAVPDETSPTLATWHSLDFFRPIGAALFHSARKAARLQEPVVGLFTKRLASRHPSGSWAQLHAGFGDIFANDTVGRFRMNGAGQQDPDTAYLKLSFRF